MGKPPRPPAPSRDPRFTGRQHRPKHDDGPSRSCHGAEAAAHRCDLTKDRREDVAVATGECSRQVEKPGSTTVLAAVDQHGQRSMFGDVIRELNRSGISPARDRSDAAVGPIPVDITRRAPYEFGIPYVKMRPMTPLSMMPLEEAPRLIDQVYKRLLDAISDHTLPPGSRIRQDELADRLRVSRQPISHALHLLYRQGLVVEAGRKGFRVTPVDPDHIRRLYEVRGALDGLAARLAASRVREDQAGARKLESALHQGRDITADTPLPELIRLDVAFHQALYRLSGNPAIEDTIGPQWPHMRRSMACVLSTPRYPLTVWEEHGAITKRVLASDPDKAERAARSHALAAGRTIEQRLRCS